MKTTIITDDLREAIEWAIDEAETAGVIATEASKDESFSVRAYERTAEATRFNGYAKQLRALLDIADSEA